MTLDEICDAALARCGEWGSDWTTPRTTMYARIQTRLRQLFQRAGQLRPELVAHRETVAVEGDGTVALDGLEYDLVRLLHVSIASSGDYDADEPVNVVGAADAAAFLPPRVIARMGTLVPVGDDFEDVDEVTLDYVREPELPEAGTDEPEEVPPQHHGLFVVDLTRDLARRAVALDRALKVGIVELLDAEELGLLADFDAYVTGYAPTTSRFTPADPVPAAPATTEG
jgi:hypothetical protein